MIERGFPNIISENLTATKKWHVDLLGWAVEFESDWFIHLKAPDSAGIELGILAAESEIAPSVATPGARGTMLSFVVENVDVIHARATELGYDVLEPPTDLFYGQRRMLLTDPDGTLVDISSECPPSQEFLDSLGG